MIWIALLSACFSRRTWPDPQQEARVEGLSAEVRVRLDDLGVPHITAASMDDAAAATGWLHARDRGFQLELLRHAAQGRLTELFGESLLSTDRKLRILTWQLDEQVAGISAAERTRLQRYCDGINAGFAASPAPLEFKLLGHEPAPWTVRDVVSVMRLQAWDTSSDAAEEALRDRTSRVVPADTLAWLMTPTQARGASILEADPSAWPDLPPLPDPPVGVQAAAAVPVSASAAAPEIREIIRSEGSNAFALSGDRTADGRPLLAGDPHLSLPWPSFFYEVSIDTPDIDLHGASVPGMPGLLIGQTPSVAWSLTNSYVDVQDLYRLDVDGTRYRLDGQWAELTPWPQAFIVGEEVIEETFYASVHGPLFNPGREDDLDGTYAIEWIGFEPFEAAHTVLDEVYTAQTGEAVAAHASRISFPAQSWIFATASGDIGYTVNGLLPNHTASLLPRDGTVSPPADRARLDADRPLLVNPDSGIIVSTNQALFAHPRVNGRFSGAWRSLRAQTVLSSRSDWTAEGLVGLQVDTVNLEAAMMLPVLQEALAAAVLSEAEQEALSLLADWDFRMLAASPAPLIYEAWRGQLHRYLLGLHLDEGLVEDWLISRLSEAPVTTAVLTDVAVWDDPATPDAIETRQTGALLSLRAAIAQLSADFGARPSRWTWGEAHTLTLDHPFAAKVIMRPWFGFSPIGVDGGRHVLHALGHEGVVGDFTVESGAALRLVAVPGGEGSFVVAGGSTGQPGHRHSLAQLDDWLINDQHPMTPPAEGGESGRIILRP